METCQGKKGSAKNISAYGHVRAIQLNVFAPLTDEKNRAQQDCGQKPVEKCAITAPSVTLLRVPGREAAGQQKHGVHPAFRRVQTIRRIRTGLHGIMEVHIGDDQKREECRLREEEKQHGEPVDIAGDELFSAISVHISNPGFPGAPDPTADDGCEWAVSA